MINTPTNKGENKENCLACHQELHSDEILEFPTATINIYFTNFRITLTKEGVLHFLNNIFRDGDTITYVDVISINKAFTCRLKGKTKKEHSIEGIEFSEKTICKIADYIMSYSKLF